MARSGNAAVLLGVGGAAALVLLMAAAAASSPPAQEVFDMAKKFVLGKWFELSEFTRNGRGLPNDPTAAQAARIKLLVASTLDPLREGLGVAITITSGFRSAAVNEAVDGSTTSQHMEGEAADIKAHGLTAPELIERIIALRIPFDQCIGYVPEHGGHVHISYTGRRPNRGQILWVPEGPKRYVPYKTVRDQLVA